jgi:hypothetical protein
MPPISEGNESKSNKSGATTARGAKPRADELFRPDSGHRSGSNSDGQRSGSHSGEGPSGPPSAESDEAEPKRVKGHHRGRSVPNKAALMHGKKGN